jgi:hypothetical protein
MTYQEALRAALQDALQRRPNVFLTGEDVGRYRAFACSKGLLEEFGPERVDFSIRRVKSSLRWLRTFDSGGAGNATPRWG